ncbi:hypothetical protein [Vulgatibacter incomptus]|uniref:Uncharacterized protein n=1 Tax=Vulgatibacter incomptus TaxID=1391653 RepID=A0A0K1PHZ3_9BACT|nr:hypothetical protein [Vulgatibacter incomptus]AKU93163.1 hypothetical protein AKJ08_3550 [Vulgatibacter incomptus]
MKLVSLVSLGVLASLHCPGTGTTAVRDLQDENHGRCEVIARDVDSCEPGIEPIEPSDSPKLGLQSRYWERIAQRAWVTSVSDSTLILEGPWDVPLSFVWFEPVDDKFAVGDEVTVDGRGDWSVVIGPNATLANADVYAFSPQNPSPFADDCPDIDFFALCYAQGTNTCRVPVYGVRASLGPDSIEIAQGERGTIGDWQVAHHGAVSARGYMEDGWIVEGYFHGTVSAWKLNSP